MMNKRDQFIGKSFTAYHDGTTIIEVVDMDVWWRVNETMTIKTLNNGQVFQGVDYFRIYRKLPWSEKDFCQVFVMYQEGQSDHMAVRLAAPLRNADIDPQRIDNSTDLLGGKRFVSKAGCHNERNYGHCVRCCLCAFVIFKSFSYISINVGCRWQR
ncbi:hypothetical protein CHS0354_033399 [Potamilus streckersoni]|uniref:Uncharacterized protein n=1 Tax=Potamilus streckersoni TaxID=2493646 RepID=A0AAE0SQQ5_9BIVA|nr:hypothetical protein CHS0354_033399 [Potamilus streckersoni]